MARIAVSVVIPTFQRRERLARLLEALAAQDQPFGEVEVIVVDDGSSDGTRDWLAGAGRHLVTRAVEQPHLGPAAARNRGIAEAVGPLVLFLDDDVVPDRWLIRAHTEAHARSTDAVVVGPMLPPPRWRRPAWIRWEEDQLLAQYRAMREGVYPCTPRQLFTANASVPRDRLLQAGGFDARFGRAEDVELGYRLRDLGMRFVFDPDARVWHYPDRTFASWCQTPYRYGQSDVAMEREKGHEALHLALREFHTRHPLTRLAVRAAVGRRFVAAGAVRALGVAVHAAALFHAPRLASAALSVLFNLLYWQGVADELGTGPRKLWRSIAAHRPQAAA
jgi:GT2 family glycosyltransferase